MAGGVFSHSLLTCTSTNRLAPKYLISLAGSYRRWASHRRLASLHVSQKH